MDPLFEQVGVLVLGLWILFLLANGDRICLWASRRYRRWRNRR